MNRRRSLGLLFASLLPRALHAEGRPALHTFERGLMATRFAIACEHPDAALAQRAAAAAFAAAERINAVASDYIADSELLGLSRQPAGTPRQVSPLLFGLLEEARGLAETTEGCFDPTMGPLTKLWRESRRRKALPAPEVLEAARRATGWRFLRLDPAGSSVTLERPGMRLDLGGIAKGQAADRMTEELRRHGVTRSLVTAGGEVRAGDPPEGRTGWKVGVRTFDKQREVRQLELADAAVSTSGDLQQFVEIGGVRYSHIIDPATGLGLTRRMAVTVVAARAACSDALSTACCVAGRERGEALALRAGARSVFFAG